MRDTPPGLKTNFLEFSTLAGAELFDCLFHPGPIIEYAFRLGEVNDPLHHNLAPSATVIGGRPQRTKLGAIDGLQLLEDRFAPAIMV